MNQCRLSKKPVGKKRWRSSPMRDARATVTPWAGCPRLGSSPPTSYHFQVTPQCLKKPRMPAEPGPLTTPWIDSGGQTVTQAQARLLVMWPESQRASQTAAPGASFSPTQNQPECQVTDFWTLKALTDHSCPKTNGKFSPPIVAPVRDKPTRVHGRKSLRSPSPSTSHERPSRHQLPPKPSTTGPSRQPGFLPWRDPGTSSCSTRTPPWRWQHR